MEVGEEEGEEEEDDAAGAEEISEQEMKMGDGIESSASEGSNGNSEDSPSLVVLGRVAVAVGHWCDVALANVAPKGLRGKNDHRLMCVIGLGRARGDAVLRGFLDQQPGVLGKHQDERVKDDRWSGPGPKEGTREKETKGLEEKRKKGQGRKRRQCDQKNVGGLPQRSFSWSTFLRLRQHQNWSV